MTPPSPVTVSQARDRARSRLQRELRAWAVAPDAAQFQLALHPPTERAVLADQAEAIAWVKGWEGLEGVEWGTKQWPRVGTQRVPQRLKLRGADNIASFVGGSVARDWKTLASRAATVLDALTQLAARFPGQGPEHISAAVRSRGNDLLQLPESELLRAVDVIAWLIDHPAFGYRARQLPILGVDTKWLERHRGLIEHFHRAVTGQDSLGLATAPELIRLRFLDRELRPGGLGDLAAPVGELAQLQVRPSRVLVVENLETLLAMPDYQGTVAIHGKGFGVGARLSALSWIEGARILYWGDLDSHGFAILNELRAAVPDVTSVLMDEETLFGHRDLWVAEPIPAERDYPYLSAPEAQTLALLRREGNVRLEQERIDWAWAIDRLKGALEPH
ncbi:Wadjet anti-phage system protein JetD domain-containing protein [Luethyella okanaganae]|uniref:Wadjet anti-phage system protein JetD domain-containing protein n=1 Tax=Luethyella okanaganae TaxID=69372 RepID=A0ABW1VGJ2_9MICO